MKAGILAATIAAQCAFVAGAPAPLVARMRPQTGNPLLDYKLRASRAEQARREVRKAADEIAGLSASIAKHVTERGALGPGEVKSLDRIRKLARRVRSEMGGSGDAQLETSPRSLTEAANLLADRSEALAEHVHKSSRYETSARLISLAGDVIVLSDLLKQFRE